MLRPAEPLVADLAAQIIIVAMRPHVLRQIRTSGEALVALRALERLDARMRYDVSLQLVRSIEFFGAARQHLERALVLFNRIVD